MTNGDIVKIKVNRNVKLVGTLDNNVKLNLNTDNEYQITFVGYYGNKLLFKFNDESFSLNKIYIESLELIHDNLPYYHANNHDNFKY